MQTETQLSVIQAIQRHLSISTHIVYTRQYLSTQYGGCHFVVLYYIRAGGSSIEFPFTHNFSNKESFLINPTVGAQTELLKFGS